MTESETIYCYDCGTAHALKCCVDCAEQLHPPPLDSADGPRYYLSLPDDDVLCLPCARERVVRVSLGSRELWAFGGTNESGQAAVVSRAGVVIADRLCRIFHRFRGGRGDPRVRLRFRLPGPRSATDPEGKESATVWEGTLFLKSGLIYARLNRKWERYLKHCLDCLEPGAWPADIRPPAPRRGGPRPPRAAPALEL